MSDGTKMPNWKSTAAVLKALIQRFSENWMSSAAMQQHKPAIGPVTTTAQSARKSDRPATKW